MLLEQILRRQAEFVQSLKASAMSELVKKLVTVGVPVPGDLHERMGSYLALVKGREGQPRTYKELAVLCIRMAMSVLEQNAAREEATESTAQAVPAKHEKPFVDPDEDAISGLREQLCSFGAKDFSIALEEGVLNVYASDSACIAPGTMPSMYNGHAVVLAKRDA